MQRLKDQTFVTHTMMERAIVASVIWLSQLYPDRKFPSSADLVARARRRFPDGSVSAPFIDWLEGQFPQVEIPRDRSI